MKGFLYSSPIWLSLWYYAHETYHPDYMKWAFVLGGGLIAIWLLSGLGRYLNNRRLNKREMEKAWREGKLARKLPSIPQQPVVYQMPMGYHPSMTPQAPTITIPTWVDLPAERYELLED